MDFAGSSLNSFLHVRNWWRSCVCLKLEAQLAICSPRSPDRTDNSRICTCDLSSCLSRDRSDQLLLHSSAFPGLCYHVSFMFLLRFPFFHDGADAYQVQQRVKSPQACAKTRELAQDEKAEERTTAELALTDSSSSKVTLSPPPQKRRLIALFFAVVISQIT